MNTDQNRQLTIKVVLTLLGATALILLAVFVFPVQPPKPKPSPSPSQSGTSRGSYPSPVGKTGLPNPSFVEKERESWRGSGTTVSFADFADKGFDSKFKVYQKAESSQALNSELATSIANSFGFVSLPQNLNVENKVIWRFQKENKTLIIDFEDKTVEYSDQELLFNPPAVLPEIDKNKAITAATTFLKNKQVLSRFIDITRPKVSFGSLEDSHGDLVTQGPNEIAVLTYDFEIEGSPLLVRGINQLEVSVSGDGVVRGVKSRVYETSWEEQGEYSLLDLESAKVIIANSGGLMINNSSQVVGEETLKSYTLDDVSLAYYGRNDSDLYLEPIYIFSGSGVQQSGAASQVTVYLPALNN